MKFGYQMRSAHSAVNARVLRRDGKSFSEFMEVVAVGCVSEAEVVQRAFDFWCTDEDGNFNNLHEGLKMILVFLAQCDLEVPIPPHGLSEIVKSRPVNLDALKSWVETLA